MFYIVMCRSLRVRTEWQSGTTVPELRGQRRPALPPVRHRQLERVGALARRVRNGAAEPEKVSCLFKSGSMLNVAYDLV